MIIIIFNDDLASTKMSFQDGVNTIYDALVAKGVTPTSKSLNDIVATINGITIGGDIKHTLNIQTFKDGYTAVGQCTAYVDGKSVWSRNTEYATGSASGNSGNIII